MFVNGREIFMIKLCIFDLDGTLVNSLDDLADACNYALLTKGFPVHENSRYNHFVGNGIPVLMERIVPNDKKTPEILKEIRLIFDERYKNHCLCKTKPYEGISDLIKKLKNLEIKLAILSNKADSFAKYICDSIFTGKEFEIIMGQRDDIPKKPEPDAVYAISKELNVALDEIVLIGDSNVDVITAKNSGIYSIGACWGFRGEEELKKAGADFLAHSPEDCLNIINGI